MVFHIIITLDDGHPNIVRFKEWCQETGRQCSVQRGVRIRTVHEARAHLTEYGMYLQSRRRETAFHFDSLGPVGCFLAHRKAWTTCVARDEPTWIFEQGLTSCRSKAFEDIDAHHPDVDLVLGHTIPVLRPYPQRRIAHRGKRRGRLRPVDKVRFGAKCYRVTPRFAAHLLERSQHGFDLHVDSFICMVALNHCDDFCAMYTSRNIVCAYSSGLNNHSLEQPNRTFIVTALLTLVLVLACCFYRYRFIRCARRT